MVIITKNMVLKIEDDTETASSGDAIESALSNYETASSGDAIHKFEITESEIQAVTEFLPKTYDLFVFWFLMWLGFKLMGGFKSAFMKSTDRME